jgi:HK97 gp10 family phage protein
MPESVSWKINGLRELSEQLKTMPDKLLKTAIRGAVGAGAKVIRDEARSRVHNITGDLSQGIRFTTSVNLAQGTGVSKVFVSVKKAWYGRLVEFGTKPHLIKSKKGNALKLHGGKLVMQVHHPGAKPKPFMEPAAATKYQAAIDAITNRLKAAFLKFSKT